MAKTKTKQAGADEAQSRSGKKQIIRPPIVNGDLYQRMNFTLQASSFLQQIQTPKPSPTDHASSKTSPEQPHQKQQSDITRLSRNMMSANGKMVVHNQMKLDPSIKRSICDKCSTVLIPGLTSRVRNRPSKIHCNVTHTSCVTCQTRRTIPCPPTAIHDDSLDGIDRSKRRKATAKHSKIPFHEREAFTTETADAAAQKGHTLWHDQALLSGWGQTMADANPDPET